MSTINEYPFAPVDDVDDLDALLDEPDQDDTSTSTSTGQDSAPGSAHLGARGKAGANRALIRRVANKAAELAVAPTSRKETLAAMLGCSTDLADLTYAVMAADRSAMAPAADLTVIAAADPYSAALVAAALGRTRMRGVWALLVAVGSDLPAAIPPSDPKAAIALARASSQLSPDTTEELAKVTTLARKS